MRRQSLLDNIDMIDTEIMYEYYNKNNFRCLLHIHAEGAPQNSKSFHKVSETFIGVRPANAVKKYTKESRQTPSA